MYKHLWKDTMKCNFLHHKSEIQQSSISSTNFIKNYQTLSVCRQLNNAVVRLLGGLFGSRRVGWLTSNRSIVWHAYEIISGLMRKVSNCVIASKIEMFLRVVSANVVSVASERHVRRVCPSCPSCLYGASVASIESERLYSR